MPLPLDKSAILPALCESLADGQTLTSACKLAGVGVRTILTWGREEPEIKQQIEDARRIGYDVISERLRETARCKGDSLRDVQRDKLIIDTDLKLLGKWWPDKYGEKLALGEDRDRPFAALSMEQIEMRIAGILAKAQAQPSSRQDGADDA